MNKFKHLDGFISITAKWWVIYSKPLSSKGFSVFSNWLLVKINISLINNAHFSYLLITTKLHHLTASQEWVGAHE